MYGSDERNLRKVESHFDAMVSFLINFISKEDYDSQEKREAILVVLISSPSCFKHLDRIISNNLDRFSFSPSI